MRGLSPRTTLLLLLAASVLVLAGGILFSAREVTERQSRDRGPVTAFAKTLQQELQRLERLQESHLARLAQTAPVHDRQAVWRICEEVIGTAQFSLLQPGAEGDLHVPISPPSQVQWPEPAFAANEHGLPRRQVLLSQAELLEGKETSGWIDQPGQPLMFWLRRAPNACAVLTVDSQEAARAVDGWLEEWLAGRFAGLGTGGAMDQIESPLGKILRREGNPSAEAADYVIPLRARFGTWQIASHEPRMARMRYSIPVLIGSAALAALLAGLSLFVSSQQRRALRTAEERVSFVNAVSHELRAPLTNILLNVEFARESLAGVSVATDHRLCLVDEEARRLARLIDNVLTFSRQERKSVEMRPRGCVPATVAQSVIAQFAPSFARRGLEIVCENIPGETRLLDADALAQILGNLLSNVEKYVPGGKVEIAGGMDEAELVLTVTDEGPGIAVADFERVFLPFERLQDSRANLGISGTGLGLSIARGLAEEMGGSLKLRPSARGACFELRVPAPTAALIHSVSAA